MGDGGGEGMTDPNDKKRLDRLEQFIFTKFNTAVRTIRQDIDRNYLLTSILNEIKKEHQL